MARWSYEKVPLYRRLGRRAERLGRAAHKPELFWQEWREIPLLAKTELRAHSERLMARQVPPAHLPLETLKTSGSTGVPVEVRATAVTRLMWNALTVREHLWRGRDFSKRLGVMRYFPPERRSAEGTDQPSWGNPVAQLYATGVASAIHIGFPIDILAGWLRRFDPHYLLAYPSIVPALLDVLPDKPPALEEVRFISEPLDSGLERWLAEKWGVRCSDTYSANEVGYIAFRCPEQGNSHVQSESVMVEVLDDRGRMCGVGESGRVVVTSLHNQAMPLLRYDLGDYVTVGAACACGRGSPVIGKVLGRVRNLVRTPDGRRYWPVALGKVRAVQPILQAQFVQADLETIQIRVVLSRPLREGELSRVGELAREALGYPFRVDVVRVESIERGPSGKFEEFLSRLDD
ncbi:MAG: phenylacetate--CoA ligase family protein [Methylomagnum sp.]